MDLPREDTLIRIGSAEVLDTNTDLALTAVTRDGTDSNNMIAGGAAMGGEVVAQLAAVIEGNFLDTATGIKLDKLIWDRYGILRKSAGPSFVDVQFSTTAPAATAFNIPAGTALSSSDGKQFLTIDDVVYPIGSVGPVAVQARSQLAGVNQAVAPGKITSIVAAIAGQPADLVVTNALASAGGADRERDDDFRARARKFWRAFRGGVKSAIEFAALSVSGVVKATAFEGLDSVGRQNRIGALVVTDQWTDALVKQGVAVPAYATQSQAFARVVFNGLEEWRAMGISIDVIVAQVILVPMTLRLRFRAGANTQLATLMARAVAVDVCNSLRPGDTLNPTSVISRLRAVPGLDVVGDELENPAGIVIPTSPYQVLRTTLALVQVSTLASVSIAEVTSGLSTIL